MEALIATSLFALIVGVVVTEIQAARRRHQKYLQEAERQQVAKMAIQTGQDFLSLNDTNVRVSRDDKGLIIYYEGEVVLDVREN